MRGPLLCLSLLLGTAPPAAWARPATLLAVMAHPDDETLVGPLLAASARRGLDVHLVVVTDGALGVSAHAGLAAGAELAAVRADEVRCSARALGIRPPLLLGFADGGLGNAERPPWRTLERVAAHLREQFARLRPDVVVTFGPEGGYGHPDHRLVGAVVTELVQAAVDGAPAALYYPGFPTDRLPPNEPGGLPWLPTDPRYLSVRIAYSKADLAATRAALACHRSQFRDEDIERETQWTDRVLGGRVPLRPWFGRGDARVFDGRSR